MRFKGRREVVAGRTLFLDANRRGATQKTIPMKLQNIRTTTAVGALVIAALVSASPAHAQSQPAAQTLSASASDSGAVPVAYTPPAAKTTLRQKVNTLITKLTPERIKRDIEYRKASALFPDFCKHWEQDLHERETNNLSKLEFVPREGFETATYTGYGKIAACESHQSKDGYSIGKITYEEYTFYLSGKSEDEARHAVPKTINDLRTTEIFRWDKDKWFY
ncbi:MAG: hypothetical protein WA861_18580 [Candidatus Binatus sp.]